MKRYIDLTHTIANDMPEWPGCAPVELKEIVTVQKDGVENHRLNGSCHMGTHIDAPGHFIAHGKKISEYPVDKFMGQAITINALDKTEIGVELVKGLVKRDDIVLLYTGWGNKLYDSGYFYQYPVVSPSCAQYLVDQKIKMVGIDGPSVDCTPFEIHKLLLSHDILIIENLTNLQALLGLNKIELFALPLKLDAHGAPARVIANGELCFDGI